MSQSYISDEITMYQTRAFTLPTIKRNHKIFFKTLVGESDATPEKESDLSYKEFIILNYVLHFSVNSLVQMSDLAFKYGPGYIAASFVFLELTLGMPLLMLCCFLSSYSKKSFITFWACVPLFEGLGYTMVFVQFMVQMYNVVAASISLLAIAELTHYEKRRKVLNCELSQSDGLCFTPNSNRSYDCTKWAHLRNRNETIYTALQYHLRLRMMEHDEFNSACCTINTKMLAVVICLWVIIFMVSMLGLTRIKKVTLNGVIVFTVLLFMMCTYSVSFIQVDYENAATGKYGNQSLLPFLRFDVCIIIVINIFYLISFDMKIYHSYEIITDGDYAMSPFVVLNSAITFWVESIVHAGGGNPIAVTIWLGSLKGHGFTPQHAFLTITFIKIIACIGMFCFTSRVLHSTLKLYNIKYFHCLRNTGNDLILAFIPEELLRAHFGGMAALLWYFIIFYFSLLSPIYSVIGVVNTIMERYSFLAKYRLVVYLVTCLIGTILSIPLCLNINVEIIEVFRNFGLPLIRAILLFLVIFALMFMYSTNRIIDDYSFTYGRPPEKYWIMFWKTSPLIALIACIFTLYKMKMDVFASVRYNLVIGSYTHATITLLPILITFAVKCCMHVKYKTLASLSKPTAEWGPYSPIKRHARQYFYPQRDVKYRNTSLKCIHKCIVNSGYYYNEIRTQQANLNRVVKRFETNNHYELSDLKTN